MELPVACRHVVGDEIAEHMGGRVRLGHMLGRRADHDAQFDLVIELLGHARIDVVIGAAQATRLLV